MNLHCYLSWSNVFKETGLFKSFITNNFWNFVRKIWLWVCHIFLSNNRLSCEKLNYVYTLFCRKNTKMIPLQSIKIGLSWIIVSSFSRYIVNILAGEEHWRFHKGEVTAYAQNIWYFQKNIFIWIRPLIKQYLLLLSNFFIKFTMELSHMRV